MIASSHKMRGFTLIEVVIAFAILGVSLSVLYGAFEGALSRTRRDARFSEATLIAQSLLARAGSEIPWAQQDYSGEWEGYAYQLSQEIRTATGSSSSIVPSTVRIVATVSWPSGTETRNIQLSTLKLVSKVEQ